MSNPLDLERLVQEALTELGWEADSKEVAEKISRLNIGLPREDEFSIVCSWLGKCKLIHKLDQKQHPPTSKDHFQVPDLFALFEGKEKQIATLIEVKSSKAKKLSFKPVYFKKLQNYADLHGHPLLIAWKFHALWILFDMSCMKKAKKN